jgi:hypothetical protein
MRARRFLAVAMVAVAAVGVTACGDDDSDKDSTSTKSTATETTTEVADDDEGSEAKGALVVHLSQTAGSGVTGIATLSKVDDETTKVSIKLADDPSGESHPAHIHAGNCAKFDQAPKYPLTNVEDGGSETEIEASLADLAAEPYIINVHKSDEEISTYVACGTVSTGGKPLVAALAQQANSNVTGTVTLTPQGDDKTVVKIQLRGDASTDPHPAHIHDGTCEDFDQAPAYPLENVENGTSTTTVDAPLQELLSEPYIVNVHKSEAEISTYISCGTVA